MANIPVKNVGWGFLKIFKFSIILIYFLYLIISAILIGIENRDFGLTLKNIGEKFYNPLQNAQDVSLGIINDSGKSTFGNIWDYWSLYFSVGTIFIWIKVLSWIWSKSPFSDESRWFVNWGMGALTFFIIQLLFGAYYLDESPNFIFSALKDIFRGLIYIFSNFNIDFGKDKLVNSVNNCTEDICTI